MSGAIAEHEPRVLIVGSGAREHALAWALGRDGVDVYVAPGNAGIEPVRQVNLNPKNIGNIVEAAQDLDIDLVVIGSEDTLARGVVDALHIHGKLAYGPTERAAQLETSKIFSAEFLKRHSIASPDFETFDSFEEALSFVRNPRWENGVVVKADGLAGGKGVFVCDSPEEAEEALMRLMLDKEFGDAGRRVVIQEKLVGFELSAQVSVDGKNFVMYPFAEDYKQVNDEDRGPNTGGMGAEAPHPLVTPEDANVIEQLVAQTIAGLRDDGIDFRGTLYLGIMMTLEGPKILEYNVRFGDPETEVIMPLLNDPLYPVLEGAAKGHLPITGVYPTKEGRHTVGVFMTSGGYPKQFETGFPISGLEEAKQTSAEIFHGGTGRKNGDVVTTGGRVLIAVGEGATSDEARDVANLAVSKIRFQNEHHRRDIGARARKGEIYGRT